MSLKICSKCGAEMMVTDSRERPSGEIYRRRTCPKCGHRTSSTETEWINKREIVNARIAIKDLVRVIDRLNRIDVKKLLGELDNEPEDETFDNEEDKGRQG